MQKTFVQLQTAIASMLGYEATTDLMAQDLIDVKTCINQAYVECYQPVRGVMQEWARKNASGMFRTPASASLGLTEGSTVVTEEDSFEFEAAYIGSFVSIGGKYFKYAGEDSSGDHHLTAPWPGSTGTETAIVYYNAYSLPWNVIGVIGNPETSDNQLLSAISPSDGENYMRFMSLYDFHNESGQYSHNTLSINMNFDTGTPKYYHIESASVHPDFAVGTRIHVWPVPETQISFSLMADVVPIDLDIDGDIPKLPGYLVDQALLPLAYNNVVNHASLSRRYTGLFVPGIKEQAAVARRFLDETSRPQRNPGPQRFRSNNPRTTLRGNSVTKFW
jgi:hypothetical protein